MHHISMESCCFDEYNIDRSVLEITVFAWIIYAKESLGDAFIIHMSLRGPEVNVDSVYIYIYIYIYIYGGYIIGVSLGTCQIHYRAYPMHHAMRAMPYADGTDWSTEDPPHLAYTRVVYMYMQLSKIHYSVVLLRSQVIPHTKTPGTNQSLSVQ